MARFIIKIKIPARARSAVEHEQFAKDLAYVQEVYRTDVPRQMEILDASARRSLNLVESVRQHHVRF